MEDTTAQDAGGRPARRFRFGVGSAMLLVVIAALVAAQVASWRTHRRRLDEIAAISQNLNMYRAELSVEVANIKRVVMLRELVSKEDARFKVDRLKQKVDGLDEIRARLDAIE